MQFSSYTGEPEQWNQLNREIAERHAQAKPNVRAVDVNRFRQCLEGQGIKLSPDHLERLNGANSQGDLLGIALSVQCDTAQSRAAWVQYQSLG